MNLLRTMLVFVSLTGFALANDPGGEVLSNWASTEIDFLELLPNRDKAVAIGIRRVAGDDSIFFHSDSGSGEVVIPNSERLMGFDFSNWGAAAWTDASNSITTYVGQPNDTFAPVFVSTGGTHDPASINDLGLVALPARPTNSTGNLDVWWWRPGETSASKLPHHGGTEVGEFAFVDNAGRVVTTVDIGNRTELLRYDASLGWQNLTDPSNLRATKIAKGIAKGINANGDIVFPTGNGPSFRLALYDDSTNSAELISGSLNGPEARLAPRLVSVAIADDASVYTAVNRGDIELDMDIQFLRADGVSRNTKNSGFGVDTLSTTAEMSLNGRFNIYETISDDTGLHTYWGADFGSVVAIDGLRNLTRGLERIAVTNEGKVFYVDNDGSNASLGWVWVPEPDQPNWSILLLLLISARRMSCLSRPFH